MEYTRKNIYSLYLCKKEKIKTLKKSKYIFIIIINYQYIYIKKENEPFKLMNKNVPCVKQ